MCARGGDRKGGSICSGSGTPLAVGHGSPYVVLVTDAAFDHSYSAQQGETNSAAHKVGAKVFLKSLIKHNRDVALATIMSCDPKFKLDGVEIGNEYWVVHVDMAFVKTENLIKKING
ncbi:hypothetical protein D1007_47860 [Hordeum vulgare]|nr:hypothetical protein D1007_47860 [Hordeum vulgare]